MKLRIYKELRNETLFLYWIKINIWALQFCVHLINEGKEMNQLCEICSKIAEMLRKQSKSETDQPDWEDQTEEPKLLNIF